MRSYRIFVVGLGQLGSHILDLLMRTSGKHHFLVGGRDLKRIEPRANLSLLTAMQLGYSPTLACTSVVLANREQTAETIAQFRPDIIVCAATMQRLGLLESLPKQIADKLAQAQLGPRLPLHMVPIYQLMQAIKMTNFPITVLNAIYPDVVHPILAKVGLAPTTGIGDLANNIPAVKQTLAWQFDVDSEEVDVRLVMARYVSYTMSRARIAHLPFHVSATIKGEDVTHLIDKKTVFDQLTTTLKRSGGNIGLMMTASSAAQVFLGLMTDTPLFAHVPGPHGLPGGYPVIVGAGGIQLALPPDLSQDEAIQINTAGLRYDGIERITEDGTVHFSEPHMAIYKEVLGYHCPALKLDEVEECAQELLQRFAHLPKTASA